MKRTLIIAEAGVNHNGSLERAFELVEAAAKAGADAVKFQTFKASTLVSKTASKAHYQRETTSESESQYEMIQALELDEKAHRTLLERCRARKIEFLSTPFDLESVDLLKGMGVSLLKISSGDLTNAPLLLKCAASGKPVILSTGMSTLGEIEAALGVLAYGLLSPSATPSANAISEFREAFRSDRGRRLLAEKVTLLHCTTEYPAPFNEVNLRAMETMKTRFSLKVGYSDHTPGITVPVAAVALGAEVIEKHFTLDRNLPGPDHKASLEPGELGEMVRSIRIVEQALGNGEKVPAPSEVKNIEIARRSLVAARPIKKGERYTEQNLGIKRPGSGLSPFRFWEWLAKSADRDHPEDDRLS